MTHNHFLKRRKTNNKAAEGSFASTLQLKSVAGGLCVGGTHLQVGKKERGDVLLAHLSFWQTNRLKAFSAPRKLSSSRISTALIQLGLKSRAICP